MEIRVTVDKSISKSVWFIIFHFLCYNTTIQIFSFLLILICSNHKLLAKFRVCWNLLAASLQMSLAGDLSCLIKQKLSMFWLIFEKIKRNVLACVIISYPKYAIIKVARWFWFFRSLYIPSFTVVGYIQVQLVAGWSTACGVALQISLSITVERLTKLNSSPDSE